MTDAEVRRERRAIKRADRDRKRAEREERKRRRDCLKESIMDKKELVVFEKLLIEAEMSLELSGGCDHLVGLCACDLINTIEEAREIIKKHEQNSVT